MNHLVTCVKRGGKSKNKPTMNRAKTNHLFGRKEQQKPQELNSLIVGAETNQLELA